MSGVARHCEIAVVGGGLVGAVTTRALREAGFDAVLIERAERPQGPVGDDAVDLRVYAIAPNTQRFLGKLGIWARLDAARFCAYTSMQVWEQEPTRALCFDAADAQIPALGYIAENSVLQAAAWAALPADAIAGGCSVAAALPDDEGVELRFDDGGRWRADLLVVAEGRDSNLRRQLGIEMMAGRYEQSAVVAHVRTEAPHLGQAYQRFLASGPLALLPLADGRVSIVWSSSESERLLSLDDEAFCAALTDASQQRLGAVLATTRRVSFPLSLQHAERYVAPRSVLVGDAAHVVHPLAGQGVNLGIADAEALAATLGAARRQGRNPAAARVLARYERARRADVNEMIAVTDGLYRAYHTSLSVLGAARSQAFAWLDRAGPLKRQLIRRAAGLS